MVFESVAGFATVKFYLSTLLYIVPILPSLSFGQAYPLAVQQWLADALFHISAGLLDTFITVVRFKIPVKSIFFKFFLENIWW